MRALLSIKFPGDDSNRLEVESIISAMERAGMEVFLFRRDAEKWGRKQFKPDEMMSLTFKEIENSDLLIADVGDWPIGVGVEVGYACGKGIPVICICREDKKLPGTVSGLATKTIQYQDIDDLSRKLDPILSERQMHISGNIE